MTEQCELPTLHWFLSNVQSVQPRDGRDFSNTDERPPYKYSQIVADAFVFYNYGQLSLTEIYNYFTTKFGFFRQAHQSWRNSVRHLLSLDDRFIKVPRDEAKSNRGALWMLDRSVVYADGTLKTVKSTRQSRCIPKPRAKREIPTCVSDKPHLNAVIVRYLAKMQKLQEKIDMSTCSCSSPSTQDELNVSDERVEVEEYYGAPDSADESFLEDFGLTFEDVQTASGRFSPDLLDQFLAD